MPRQNIGWSPSQRNLASVVNSRVCLAILRIFREARLGVERHLFDDIVRPLWPALRLEQRAMKAALVASAGTVLITGPRIALLPDSSTEDAETEMPAWLAAMSDPRAVLPLDPPENDAFLKVLGSALVNDRADFRAFFDSVEQRLERRAAQPLTLDRNIDWLGTLLDMSDLEKRVLALCAALELGSISRETLTYVGRTVRRIRALGAACRCTDEHELAAVVGRQGTLQHSGLLRPGDRSDADLDDLLRLSRLGSLLTTACFESIEEMSRVVLKPLPAARGSLYWPHLADRTDLLADMLRNTIRTGEAGINILLYGAPGTGKTEYARQLVRQAGALGFRIDECDNRQRAASRDERLGSLRLSDIFAPVGKSVLVLDEAEDIFRGDYTSPLRRVMGAQEDSKAWMNQRLESNRVPVIWISNQVDHIDPAYLRRFTYCLEFPVPPREQRRDIARTHLAPIGASTRLIEEAATHATLPAALLASAARFATLSGAGTERVDGAVRLMLTDQLRAMGQPFRASVVDGTTRFDLAYLNVAGSAQPAPMISGLARTGRGSVLLAGPPGTGKTQLASRIARELGRDLVYRTAADINSKWYGESERNVADLFTHCDPRGEVLFLDEADTLLGDRGTTAHRADRAVTAEFLRRVEAFEGVFICATNHARVFDAALMRRFVFRIELLPLSAAQREALFRECVGSASGGAAIDDAPLEAMPRLRLRRLDELTPGDFANVGKRFAALGLAGSVDAWITELEAEHRAKPGCARGAIGFL